MNFKLKALVAALAMTAAASAGAATTPAGGNSSVIFSAWDANNSYSLDLGSFLNDFIGADPTGGSNSGNTLTAANSAYTGTVAGDGTLFNIKLTGFNLTSGSWNLAAGDSSGRKRLLVTDTSPLTGLVNSQLTNANGSIAVYLGLGAAASTTTGTTATSTDPWYANSSTWGDTLGAAGLNGSTSTALGSAANLYVAWQQSSSSANASLAANFAQLTANGQNVTAFTQVIGADTYLTIQAQPVPEADTWAMMMAGLGLMGFIVRRRSKV